jgi:hypothetical protein
MPKGCDKKEEKFFPYYSTFINGAIAVIGCCSISITSENVMF